MPECFGHFYAIHWQLQLTLQTISSHSTPVCFQPKPLSLPCTINLFLPSLISKSPVSASSIFLKPLTPSSSPYYFKDCLSDSVLLKPRSSVFSKLCFSSKHWKGYLVVFRKVQFFCPSC